MKTDLYNSSLNKESISMRILSKFYIFLIYIIISFLFFTLLVYFNLELKEIFFSFFLSLIIATLLYSLKLKIPKYIYNKKIIIFSILLLYFFNLILLSNVLAKDTNNIIKIDWNNFLMLNPILKIEYKTIDEFIEDIKSKQNINKILKVIIKNDVNEFTIIGAEYKSLLLNRLGFYLLIILIFYLLFIVHMQQKDILIYRVNLNFSIIGFFLLLMFLSLDNFITSKHQNIESLTKSVFQENINHIYINENHQNLYKIKSRN